ncbi:MAG TPA: hypothetical protein VHZ26_03890 [Caulobacteraceae bacterium]|jgi:hypothetical protein|nr:hypothetical protein [Caulobacteraceae bacterium]
MARQGESVPAYRPRPCLRVGVSGHRTGPKLPEEAEPAIRATVARLFDQLSRAYARSADDALWAFGPEPPQLVVVSALAEGADRIVAEVGLDHGAVLDVVLPASRDYYARDFTSAESRSQYRRLLGRARSVFELGTPDGTLAEKRGYEGAGLIMLAHADILIAIWDEGESAGIGGTANMVQQAVSEGMPILLINPATPSEARLLWTGGMELPPARVRTEDLPASDAFAALPELVETLIAPPDDAATRSSLLVFYGEPPASMPRWPLYSALLQLLAVRQLRATDFLPRDVQPYSPDQWRALFPGPPEPLTETVCNLLLPAITLPNRYAMRYGELYRSAFVFNFLAAAVAVTLALLGLSAELPWLHDRFDENGRLLIKVWLATGEISLLAAIVVIWSRGASEGWHRRWLDYRRAAEWLRQLRVLGLVGARSPIPRPRRRPPIRPDVPYAARQDQDDWVGWYVRAVERLMPPPNRAADADYLQAARTAVITVELRGQINYHHDNSRHMELAARRLHRSGQVLFWTPALVGISFILAYFAYRIWGLGLAYDGRFYATAVTAALPAFGAALYAIRVQGDFETVAARSEEMAARLSTIREVMNDEPIDFFRLSDLIQRAAAVMSAEQSEWRTLFSTRPLSLPA